MQKLSLLECEPIDTSESNLISITKRLGSSMPDPNKAHSNFNVDAMISLGKLEEGVRALLQTQMEHNRTIQEIQNKFAELATLAQLQKINTDDIHQLKIDVVKFKEQRAWLAGASAIIGAALSAIVSSIMGHHQ